MVKCPKRVVQCAVPGCQVMIRLSEIVAHNRENTTKHLDLYEIDRQKKAWSLNEVRVFLLMIIKLVIYVGHRTVYSTTLLIRRL